MFKFLAAAAALLAAPVLGQGTPVVLLHGFGDTGDMWAPLAAAEHPQATVNLVTEFLAK